MIPVSPPPDDVDREGSRHSALRPRLVNHVAVTCAVYEDGVMTVSWNRLDIPTKRLVIHALSSAECLVPSRSTEAALTACWNGAVEALSDMVEPPLG